MRRLMNKAIVFNMAAAVCLTAGTSSAGFKDSSAMTIVVGAPAMPDTWVGTAILSTVRNNVSSVERVSCQVQRALDLSGNELAPSSQCTFVTATDAKTCTSPANNIAAAIESMGEDSRIRVSTDPSGLRCMNITVTNGSQYSPKGGL